MKFVWGLNLLDGRKHSQEKIFMENVINERNVSQKQIKENDSKGEIERGSDTNMIEKETKRRKKRMVIRIKENLKLKI